MVGTWRWLVACLPACVAYRHREKEGNGRHGDSKRKHGGRRWIHGATTASYQALNAVRYLPVFFLPHARSWSWSFCFCYTFSFPTPFPSFHGSFPHTPLLRLFSSFPPSSSLIPSPFVSILPAQSPHHVQILASLLFPPPSPPSPPPPPPASLHPWLLRRTRLAAAAEPLRRASFSGKVRRSSVAAQAVRKRHGLGDFP